MLGATIGGALTMSSTTGTLANGSLGAFFFVAAAEVVCLYVSVTTGTRRFTTLCLPCVVPALSFGRGAACGAACNFGTESVGTRTSGTLMLGR